MRKLFKILTPENVNVEFELAGLGSRTLAAIVDSLVQGALLLVVIISMLLAGVNFEELDWYGSLVIALGIAILFIVFFGYYIFFEMLMNGQTPGKKAAKLRVVRKTGEPVTIFDSFIRNILRIVDMLPSLYLVGSVFLIFSRDYQRIGDLAANTIVVKTGAARKNVESFDELMADYSLKSAQKDENGEDVVNIYPVSNFEYGILKDFLKRKNELGLRFPVFVNCLSGYFLRKFGLNSLPYGNPIAFFEEIVNMNSGI